MLFGRLKAFKKLCIFVAVLYVCAFILGIQRTFGWKSLVVGYYGGYHGRYSKTGNSSIDTITHHSRKTFTYITSLSSLY